jgi:surface antigen
MKLILKLSSIILACTMLQGCQGDGGINKQGAGTIIGGAAGGLLGSRFGKGSGKLATTGIGALAGAFIGNQIGQSMDEQDRKIAALTSQRALESGTSGSTVEWHNPDSGHSGSITPSKAFKRDDRYCREYRHKVIIGGKESEAYGTACRQPDGQWEIEK